GFATGTISLPIEGSDVATAGTGALTLFTERDITLARGASLSTVDGNLWLNTAVGDPRMSGNFVGIDVDGASIRVNGTGTLEMYARGGDSADSQFGVYVHGGGNIRGSATAPAFILGVGGAASQPGNHGVVVSGAGSTISSSGGGLSVQGNGGGLTSSSNNYGV